MAIQEGMGPIGVSAFLVRYPYLQVLPPGGKLYALDKDAKTMAIALSGATTSMPRVARPMASTGSANVERSRSRDDAILSRKMSCINSASSP